MIWQQRKERQMGIICWIIFGLIAGILKKWIMPGREKAALS